MQMMKQNYAYSLLVLIPGDVVPKFIHKENSTTFISYD